MLVICTVLVPYMSRQRLIYISMLCTIQVHVCLTVLVLEESILLVTSVHVLSLNESRLTIVSREAKKKQAVRDEQVSYLHVAPL